MSKPAYVWLNFTEINLSEENSFEKELIQESSVLRLDHCLIWKCLFFTENQRAEEEENPHLWGQRW